MGQSRAGGLHPLIGGVPGGLGRGLARLGVIDEGGGDGHRHPPPGVGQAVDHPQLQPAPRPDGREQGGHVVVEVVERREPQGVSVADPLAEGERGQDRSARALAVALPGADEHHLGVHHVGRPRLRPRTRARRGLGAGRVEPPPVGQPVRLPAAGPALDQGGVGEAGGQDRAQHVGRTPSGVGRQAAGVEVEVDLEAGGGAHHGVPGPGPCAASAVTTPAPAVGEVGVHGVVAGRPDDPAEAGRGVDAAADEDDPPLREWPRQPAQVGLQAVARLVDVVCRRGAQLELAAGLEGDAGAAGQRSDGLDHRRHLVVGRPAPVDTQGKHLQLDAHAVVRVGSRRPEPLPSGVLGGGVLAEYGDVVRHG